MSLCAVHTILKDHLVHGQVVPGKEIGIRADQMMTQDAVGTMVFLHLERLGQPRLSGRLAICYVDHNTIGVGPQNAQDHRFLQTSSAKAGMYYSKAGNGIGHHVHLERYGMPGRLLIGADSHVTTLGGLGMLAIGTGGIELATGLRGAPHYLICPAVIRVRLTGHLRPWCSAKDVILEIIRRLRNRSLVNIVLEYDGPGVMSLNVPQRAVIANMGAELGATSSWFPADEQTRSYLISQGRGRVYRKVCSDPKAEYADEIELELKKVVPMVALPSSPRNVVPVEEVAGLRVQQVAVGSCTNGFYEDLAVVAMVLKRRKVQRDVSMVMAPATRQVMRALMDSGYLRNLVDSGVRLAESTCGFCIGQGHTPGTNWVSVRTNSRNYEGRCGTKDASVYLVSPQTAVATSVFGVLTDPRKLGRQEPKPKKFKRFPISDGVVAPLVRGEKVKVERGSNLVEPPAIEKLPSHLKGVAVLILRDHVSTDHILPAGRWLKHRSNIIEYAKHTFDVIDPDFVRRTKRVRDLGYYNIIVAGLAYGEGSSREHAAICPMVLGVRVVLAKSIERIHLSNLINFGIVPLTFINHKDYNLVRQDDELELPWLVTELERNELVTVRSQKRGYEFKVNHGLMRRQIKVLLVGGLLNYLSG